MVKAFRKDLTRSHASQGAGLKLIDTNFAKGGNKWAGK
jgi:hypothetical protein